MPLTQLEKAERKGRLYMEMKVQKILNEIFGKDVVGDKK